jgi:cation-transporting ATPase 13A1
VSGSTVEWVTALTDVSQRQPFRIPFVASAMRELVAYHDLVTTEAALNVAIDVSSGEVLEHVELFSVFARMSPQGKARVIRALQKKRGAHVLMCGDGGNDVGALKQAEVGLALLSGYGNMNTTDGDAPDAANADGSAEDVLNARSKQLTNRSMAAGKRIRTLLEAKKKELMVKMQTEWIAEEKAAMEARGEVVGVMGHLSALKAVTKRLHAELNAEAMRLRKLHGNVFDVASGAPGAEAGDKAKPAGLEAAASEHEVPVVRPGDASIAAPFTTRMPSIRAVVLLIRQGRCTLLSALQQQQTMMLQSIISAVTLSVLSLEGFRSSERQIMASSWLLMTAAISFSYSSPLEKMHPVRPLRSLFHPAVFLSMLGQAAIHVACMMYAVHIATEAMGPVKLKEVRMWVL